MNGRRGTGAMTDDANAIRLHFDEDEAPAVIFNDQASPGALISWAWCQLSALDSLLASVVESRQDGDGQPDLAAAVRSILVPVINSLEFSERRADELQRQRLPERSPRRNGSTARSKKAER